MALENPELREKWINILNDLGARIATIISEKAIVSKTDSIGEGSVIMVGEIIQTGATIGIGLIISADTVVDHNAVTGKFCHVNCNSVIPAGKNVPDKLKVNYG